MFSLRYGTRLQRDNWKARIGLISMGEETVSQVESKLEWEGKLLDKEQQEEETLAITVTYQSDQSDMEWHYAAGVIAKLYNPPGLIDDLILEPINRGYSENTDLPALHIMERFSPWPIEIISLGMSPTRLTSQMFLNMHREPKIRREDLLASAPRSLFDRPKPLKIVLRQLPGLAGTAPFPPLCPAQYSYPLPCRLTSQYTEPVWTILEDCALHQAVAALQNLPLSLTTIYPRSISNWDIVSDMVNVVYHCFCSGKQCRARYESTMVPREECRNMYAATPTKKLRKAMKTGALFKTDNNNASSSGFEFIRSIANMCTPTAILLVNPTNHAAVLAERGISYNTHLTPLHVEANGPECTQPDEVRTAQLPNQATTATSNPQSALLKSSLSQTQPGLSIATSVAPMSYITQHHIVAPMYYITQHHTTPSQAVFVGISKPLQRVGQHAVLQNFVIVTGPYMQNKVTVLSVEDFLKNTVVATFLSGIPAMFTSGVITNTATSLEDVELSAGLAPE